MAGSGALDQKKYDETTGLVSVPPTSVFVSLPSALGRRVLKIATTAGESDDLAFDTTSSSSDEAEVSEATLPSEPDDDDEQLSLSDAGYVKPSAGACCASKCKPYYQMPYRSASASASQRSQSRAKPETAGRRRYGEARETYTCEPLASCCRHS
jgi:hypothetical protein